MLGKPFAVLVVIAAAVVWHTPPTAALDLHQVHKLCQAREFYSFKKKLCNLSRRRKRSLDDDEFSVDSAADPMRWLHHTSEPVSLDTRPRAIGGYSLHEGLQGSNRDARRRPMSVLDLFTFRMLNNTEDRTLLATNGRAIHSVGDLGFLFDRVNVGEEESHNESEESNKSPALTDSGENWYDIPSDDKHDSLSNQIILDGDSGTSSGPSNGRKRTVPPNDSPPLIESGVWFSPSNVDKLGYMSDRSQPAVSSEVLFVPTSAENEESMVEGSPPIVDTETWYDPSFTDLYNAYQHEDDNGVYSNRGVASGHAPISVLPGWPVEDATVGMLRKHCCLYGCTLDQHLHNFLSTCSPIP
ncbi:uncharacterized protein LOC108681640 [Hyalella azteca]|uniref:Uncharacterized protein LOC108681640 n=1 Tax=Hyalella azteca TaxID=294128 RepID=A0A8B7PL94_HYAAZ|nr:uncharacterized protein LOC108681640 [Hyalella azteca]XP_047741719.1 uncharacterized protein LOC108681640 [Hyalella azteca]